MKDNSLWVLGHRISPVEVSGNYDMVIGETPPEVPGPPPHFHSKLNEVFYVLEGEMEFMVNGEIKKLKNGDAIDLQPNAMHTFKNDGTTTCKWVNIHSPKGFLAFFREMGVPGNEPDAIKKSVDEHIIRRVMAEAASYDMHIKTEG
jgi:mannose-6-phosphate isomerase-like protein (cupin superfamily)